MYIYVLGSSAGSCEARGLGFEGLGFGVTGTTMAKQTRNPEQTV